MNTKCSAILIMLFYGTLVLYGQKPDRISLAEKEAWEKKIQDVEALMAFQSARSDSFYTNCIDSIDVFVKIQEGHSIHHIQICSIWQGIHLMYFDSLRVQAKLALSLIAKSYNDQGYFLYLNYDQWPLIDSIEDLLQCEKKLHRKTIRTEFTCMIESYHVEGLEYFNRAMVAYRCLSIITEKMPFTNCLTGNF